MADAKAKTINLLLYEGDLEGVISIEDSSWNSGELYSAPRDSVSELLETDACKKYGVYLLLSKSMVYVGQSSDLSKRITQHTVGKDWWESVVILATKDDSLQILACFWKMEPAGKSCRNGRGIAAIARLQIFMLMSRQKARKSSRQRLRES